MKTATILEADYGEEMTAAALAQFLVNVPGGTEVVIYTSPDRKQGTRGVHRAEYDSQKRQVEIS